MIIKRRKKENKGFSYFFINKKKAQVTIFIIIAIVLITLVAGYFVFKDKIKSTEDIPANIEPVYNSFLSCLEETTLQGIDIAESQGGYIYLPEFESGSRYMPFSSELNFMGNSIPYWYYVSGNNIQKEKVPSKEDIENQIEKYVKENINECIFNEYKSDFLISHGDAKTDVRIFDKKVTLDVQMDLNIEGKNQSAIINKHNIEVNSFLGKLYESAKKVYNHEQETLFLENHGVDILRLYAPVDGVELDCSPLVWNTPEIFNNLKNAIEANTFKLKGKNNNYNLRKKEDKYFLIDTPVEENVNFIYSKNWSTAMNVEPSEGPLLISKPVGNQAGLGVLGFCYNSYHFVYDLKYPVLIQVSTDDFKEIFQFPFAVVIQGNNPRKALNSSAVSPPEDTGICENKVVQTKINVYDSSLNKIDANISFECLNTKCDIGETKNGELVENLPQCVNGKIIVNAEGYEKTSYIHSSINSKEIDILLDRLYKKEIRLKIDNEFTNKEAMINFISKSDNSASKTIMYPQQDSIELSNGEYEIKVSVYENASIKLQETTTETCMEVPESGLGSLFGLTKEECIDVKIPPQMISSVLSAGGTDTYYMSESQLQNTKEININAFSFSKPEKIEDLQESYNLQETQELEIELI